jgi:hypothetical protein
MEVRRAALSMEYQKRMVQRNFIGIILIFCFFCIKTKDDKLFLLNIESGPQASLIKLRTCFRFLPFYRN